MKQAVNKPQPKSEQLPNMYDVTRRGDENQFYMRFYLQQDLFQYYPLELDGQKYILKANEDKILANMPFNKITYDAVVQCCLLNPFIYKNSKIHTSLIISGQDMVTAPNSKKHQNWLDFLNRPQLRMIKAAFDCLQKKEQLVLEYTVLSISNLILKLSINMSKLSCILTQKKNTSNYLATPILSILFLQFLEYVMFDKKNLVQQIQKSQFLRQLPKITVIKFSQFINKQDLHLMEIGQHCFFNKHSFMPIKHIQYLQFYQHEQAFGSQYEKLTKYEYINWINLKRQYGLQSPFSFQILFLFRTIYTKIIKDFEPDVIIFIEDYDNIKRVIDKKVRGLILNQLIDQVTGKIYFMREVGSKRTEENIFKQSSISKPESGIQKTQISAAMVDEKDQNQEKMQLENQIPGKHLASSFPNYSEIIQNCLKKIKLITPLIQKKLDEQQIKTIAKIHDSHQKYKNHPNYSYYSPILRIKEILSDDLGYVALALILKSNFEDIITMSHIYEYKPDFISQVLQHISNYWLKYYVYQGQEKKTDLEAKFKMEFQSLESMLQCMGLDTLSLTPNQFDYIIDLRDQQIKKTFLKENNQEVAYYSEKDSVHHYYRQNELLIFIFKKETFSILTKVQNQNSVHFLVRDLRLPYFVNRQNSTFVITDKYIFNGFGERKQEDTKQKYGIYRFNYLALIEDSKTKKMSQSSQYEWQFTVQSTLQKGKTQYPYNLEYKGFGWGIYDQKASRVIFAGGYTMNCVNDNKINKNLHLCHLNLNQVRVIGKTNSDIFVGYKNPKLKAIIYPFIYGIVFKFLDKCFILNTNGYEECFVNNNKLFLTQFKLSQREQQGEEKPKCGIISQSRLFVDYAKDQDRLRTISVKDHIIHYIVNSIRLTNTFKNRCILQKIDNGPLMLELIEGQAEGVNMIGLRVYSQQISSYCKQINPHFTNCEIFFHNVEP